MSITFKVSVIIPVYNAEKYVKRAVESIVYQHSVGEVILIEDGYSDRQFKICRELSDKYSIVKFFQHPNGENRGAGASRNLGISVAQFEFITFLDADDYCLPERFAVTQQKFEAYPKADLVYEPVGTDYESNEAKHTFGQWKGLSLDETEGYTTYPARATEGRAFFESLLKGDSGYPHLNGITVKKRIFEIVQPFDATLKLHQDTELLIRLAYYGYSIPGNKNHIVANRFVHPENRIPKLNFKSRFYLMRKLNNWASQDSIPQKYRELIRTKYIIAKTRKIFNSNGIFVKIIYNIIYRIV